ncbi:hypothetical protein XFF6166_440056 [Xanthomonas citri pv. fuscans]|nr:hypothetical protein XFF6166_440056 [Xanthomonas citri pv. fuscans]
MSSEIDARCGKVSRSAFGIRHSAFGIRHSESTLTHTRTASYPNDPAALRACCYDSPIPNPESHPHDIS